MFFDWLPSSSITITFVLGCMQATKKIFRLVTLACLLFPCRCVEDELYQYPVQAIHWAPESQHRWGWYRGTIYITPWGARDSKKGTNKGNTDMDYQWLGRFVICVGERELSISLGFLSLLRKEPSTCMHCYAILGSLISWQDSATPHVGSAMVTLFLEPDLKWNQFLASYAQWTWNPIGETQASE
jgi:hypothetical protein